MREPKREEKNQFEHPKDVMNTQLQKKIKIKAKPNNHGKKKRWQKVHKCVQYFINE